MESFIHGNEVFVVTIAVLLVGVFIASIMMGGLGDGVCDYSDDGDFGDWD